MADVTQHFYGVVGQSSRMDYARCDYCGRYGALGACEGCGAPNQPAAMKPNTRVVAPKMVMVTR